MTRHILTAHLIGVIMLIAGGVVLLISRDERPVVVGFLALGALACNVVAIVLTFLEGRER